MKSQAALEFMSIIAVGLTLIAVASFFGVDYITSYFSDINVINAKQTADNILSSTNLVYAQGVGATTKVYVNLPSNLVRDRTYVYGKEINLRFMDGEMRDLYRNTKVNVYGSIPLNPGRVALTIKMFSDGAYLFVNEHDIAIVYVRTFNDSNYANFDDNFSVGDTIYYEINLADINLAAKSSNVNIAIYKPDGNLFDGKNVFVNGEYKGNFSATEKGHWIISAMLPTKVVGTSVFEVS